MDVLGGYCLDKGQTAPSWMRNLDTRMEIKVLRPSQAQRDKISKIDGITFGKLSTMDAAQEPEDQLRRHLRLVHPLRLPPGRQHAHPGDVRDLQDLDREAKQDLAPVNGTLKFASEHMMELQVKGLLEAKDIPCTLGWPSISRRKASGPGPDHRQAGLGVQ